MPDSLACVALDIHRNTADLGMLPQLAGAVEWVPVSAAIPAEGMLVVPGIWLADNQGIAAQMIRDRCAAGRHTLVVPRFRAGGLQAVLGSPSSVDMSAAEFRSFEWGDHHYPIPGFTIIKTSLHAGKWAEAPGVGVVVLAYRPSTVSGAVVLCAATLTSRVVGVSPDMQKELLQRIVDAASAPTIQATDSIESAETTPPTSIDEFLEQEREIGAAYLLCRLAAGDREATDLTEVARNQLAIELPLKDVARLAGRLPSASNATVHAALQRFGWGAYLRRLVSPAAATNSEGLTR
jgi:hypothetical protein